MSRQTKAMGSPLKERAQLQTRYGVSIPQGGCSQLDAPASLAASRRGFTPPDISKRSLRGCLYDAQLIFHQDCARKETWSASPVAMERE